MSTPDDTWPYSNVEPAANWRPGQKVRMRKSVAHTITGAMSMLRSAAARADFDLPDLGELAALGLPTELLAIGVTNLRRRHHSWAEIGDALGTSREAAYQRFNRLATYPPPVAVDG